MKGPYNAACIASAFTKGLKMNAALTKGLSYLKAKKPFCTKEKMNGLLHRYFFFVCPHRQQLGIAGPLRHNSETVQLQTKTYVLFQVQVTEAVTVRGIF